MAESISDAQGRRMENPDFDPRDIITPYAFTVDESLLGTPLAAPWQRLVAFLIDLALAGFIANVAGGFVSVVVVYVFYRLATRSEITTRWKRWARGCLVAIVGAVLFGLTIALVEDVQDWGPSGPGLQALLPGVRPDTAETASPPEYAGAEGLTPTDTAPVTNLSDESGPPGSHDPEEIPVDSGEATQSARLLRRYADALRTNDSVALDTLTPTVQTLVAGDRISTLKERLGATEEAYNEARGENARLHSQLQSPSLLRMFRATVNDLGITIGWVGLYFTLFLAWWSGRTPGKYLLGIRVVRLSGEPLTLWFAFERFGGYAAGIATGMLGFAQLYWDPNRQALHDRVARTVVIRTRT